MYKDQLSGTTYIDHANFVNLFSYGYRRANTQKNTANKFLKKFMSRENVDSLFKRFPNFANIVVKVSAMICNYFTNYQLNL